jgi:hypothetical protein
MCHNTIEFGHIMHADRLESTIFFAQAQCRHQMCRMRLGFVVGEPLPALRLFAEHEFVPMPIWHGVSCRGAYSRSAVFTFQIHLVFQSYGFFVVSAGPADVLPHHERWRSRRNIGMDF